MKKNKCYCSLSVALMSCFFLPSFGHAEIFTYIDRASGVTVMSNVHKLAGSDTGTETKELVGNKGIRRSNAMRPIGFPVVTAQMQKDRDRDRRSILQKELESEQQRVMLALANKVSDESTHRHLENIAALKRELNVLSSQ